MITATDPGKTLSGNLESTLHMLRSLARRQGVSRDETSKGLVDASIELIDECRLNLGAIRNVVSRAAHIASLVPEEEW